MLRVNTVDLTINQQQQYYFKYLTHTLPNILSLSEVGEIKQINN